MKITKIEPQKKFKGRSNVYLDDTFAFGLSDFDLHKLHIKVGMELSESALASIRQDVLLSEAKQHALHLLDRHTYTEKAMARKLSERYNDSQITSEVISFLKGYRYIDDESYARRYIEAALQSGKSGLFKIKYDLCGKGISKEMVEKVATEFTDEGRMENEQETVSKLLEKKLRGDFSFPNKMKAKRYLLSRGFSSESIDSALSKLRNEGEEEWLDV